MRGDNLIKLKKEKFSWSGIVQISSSKKPTKIIRNRITNIALNELIKSLNGDPGVSNSDLVIKYLAIGTSDALLADDSIKLVNEVYRVPFISWAVTGTGQLQSRAILLGTEPAFAPYNGAVNIREIGFFGGSTSQDWDGGSGKDTGILISRILVTEDKEEDEEYQFTRTDNIGRS